MIENIKEIDKNISDIKKKVRQCMSREDVDRTIGEIHDLKYDLDKLEQSKEIDYKDHSIRELQLRHAESRVCAKGSVFLEKLIEEKESKPRPKFKIEKGKY